jgi:hypothetical protein
LSRNLDPVLNPDRLFAIAGSSADIPEKRQNPRRVPRQGEKLFALGDRLPVQLLFGIR